MNLFITSPHSVECARDLTDYYLGKAIREVSVMLTSISGVETGLSKRDIGRADRHVTTQWIAKSRGNYEWTCEYLADLHREYQRRFLSPSRMFPILAKLEEDNSDFSRTRLHFDRTFRSPFIQHLYRHIYLPSSEKTADGKPLFRYFYIPSGPVFQSYQLYLAIKWQWSNHPALWTNSSPPAWFLKLTPINGKLVEKPVSKRAAA